MAWSAEGRAGDQQFVERRQRRRKLWAKHDFPIDDRDEGELPAAIAGIAKAQALRQTQRMTIHPPTWRSVCVWGCARKCPRNGG
jgi:hypothetical protein